MSISTMLMKTHCAPFCSSALLGWALVLSFLPGVRPGWAAPAGNEQVQADLLPEVQWIQPGSPFWVGVHLDMADHWHTYWKNAGDAGLPTMVEWDLPQGFVAGEIEWPVPSPFLLEGLMNIGYEDEVLLLVQISPPGDLTDGSRIDLKARVSWLACKDVCIPGDANLSLALPVRRDAAPPDPDTSERFRKARAAVPVAADDWGVQARVDQTAHELVLDVVVSDGTQVPGDTAFFPEQVGLLDYAVPQAVTKTDRGFTLRSALTQSDVLWGETLSGLLVADKGWHGGGAREAVRFAMAFDGAAGGTGADASITIDSKVASLPVALGLALLGGLILNLMPCVFPVISLKILGFVNQAESKPREIWRHGLMFAGGVLVSFWVLAGLLLALKSAGEAVGWGFQLQSPGFVAAMSVLFLLIAMNLFGVFEVGTGFMGLGNAATGSHGLAGSFFSGVLATIVATPCTAPFMATALGFALTQPAWASMSIFTALGVGMAAPYLLLSRFPGWLARLPRPGPWMESLKQGMGFVLLGFTLYLVWVYASQRGLDALLRLLTGLLVVGIGGWVLGRWGAIARETQVKVVARVLAIGLLVAGTALGMRPPPHFGWQPYDPSTVEKWVLAGEPVFIDFTAAWCVTCQANKKVALNTQEVQDRFKDLGVRIVKADWTDQNETITRALARFGRSGVPLYLLYGREPGAEPVILPEILTKGIVLDALDRLETNGG